jgi:hypothetical protein
MTTDDTTPPIVAASYDGALKVDAQWTAIPGTPYYFVGVLQGDTVVAQGSGFGARGSVTLTSPLTAGTSYQVAAAVNNNGTRGPWGTPMTLVTGRLTALSASYDGALTVAVAWTLPANENVNAASVAVTDAGSGNQLGQALLFGSAGKLTLPAPLNSGGSYTLQASAALGNSAGPPTSVPLVAATAALRAAVYVPGQQLIQAILAAPVPGGCAPGAILYADGQLVSEQVGSPGLVVNLQVTSPLTPASSWTVRPFWQRGTVRGPLGPPAELPVAGPVLRDIRWLGGELALSWENQPGPPYPTGAQINVTAAGEAVRGASVPGATSGTFTPNPPLVAMSSYTATVANVRGTVQGPPGAGVPVVAASTALDSASYDGQTLTATWSAPAPPNATVATLLVTSAGATVVSAEGSGAASVAAPLDPAVPYSAALSWSAYPAPSQGPTGPATALISAAPTVSGVVIGSGLAVTIAPPPQAAGIVRYAAVLERGGTVIARSAPVDAGPAPVATIAYQAGLGTTGLTVRAQGLGPASGVQVSGPLGAAVPVVLVPPVIAAAALRGTTLSLSWTLPDAATALTVVVTASSGQQASFPNLLGGTAQLSLPGDLISPAISLTLVATATGPAGASPIATIALVSTLPAVTSADWDGQRLTAAWAWPPDAHSATVAKAYRLCVNSGTTRLGSVVVAGLTGVLTLDAPVDPAAALNVQVDALAGAAECLASTGPLLLAGAPELTSAVVAAGSVRLAWTGPTAPSGAVTGLLAVFTSPGYPAQTATLSAEHPVVVIPQLTADPLVPLFVVIRATGTNASGPVSNALPVLRQAPGVSAVRALADAAIEVSWSAVAGTSREYAATLYKGGAVVSTVTSAGLSATLLAGTVDPSASYAVGVTARDGAAAGPESARVTALLVAPAVTAVMFDGSGLTATWTAPTGGPVPGGYLLTVWDGGTVLAERAVTGTTAVVAVPGASGQPLSVTVTAVLGTVTGPLSTAVAALLSAPTVTAVAVDPLTGAATATFTPVQNPAASGYDVQLLRAGQPLGAPVQTTTTSVTLPGPFADQWELSVAVRARATVSSVALTGPYGPAAELLTAQPALLAADYDGITAWLAWDGTGAAGGYRASVVASGHAQPAATADASADARAIRLPVTLPDTTSDWRLVLQARRGQNTGPPVGQSLFSPGIYLRSDGQPRVFRAATLALTPAVTTVYLPEIGPLSGLPIPAGSAALQITANTDRSSSAAFPYLLTIGGAALDFSGSPAPAIRPAVQDAYTALLAQAEAGGATPWGITQLQQVISRVMPQTFAELLLYAYGLSPVGSSADLRPGMVLRVASTAFDLMSGSRPPAFASGYAEGASVDYEVADYLDAAPNPAQAPWLLGFDSFLSWLAANSVVTAPPPESADGLQSGAADAADLYYPTFRRPFYRLFFPEQVQPTTPPAQALLTRQFTLAGAATYDAISKSGPAPSPGVSVAYFRGRSVLKLAIRVTVNGADQLVPIGTTVGNLLDRLARRPPRASTELLGLTVERALGPAVLDPARYDAAAYDRVRVDYGGLQTFDRRDALSLPLLHGDRITLDLRP